MRGVLRYGLIVFSFCASLLAQQDRVSARIEDGRRLVLPGAAHPRALPENDEGAVEPAFAMQGLVLYLGQSGDQRQSLRRYLDELQNPASPSFRRFLTPEQYAERFGLSAPDLSKMRAWLELYGFQVTHMSRSRTWIAFQGTADQVERAFAAQIHRYRDQGQIHYANTRNLSIPTALDGIVIGVGGLDNFPAESDIHYIPHYNNSDGSHRLAPGDLATIYDIASLYQEGIDGTGQTIAIVGVSRLNLSDVAAFRARFNLPANVPQTLLVPGLPDPGMNSAAIESALDVEWSGAVARNATILYVYAFDPYIALQYVVDQNLAPVVSASFSLGCEQTQSPGTIAAYQQLAQQASAQGITWVNSSGDAGAAGCDPNGYPISQNGAAARFPASIPEVTAAGGTQFDEQADDGPYWNTQNDANGASALSYIPERAWNESAAEKALVAGGGGASVVFPKPAWQAGPGVPPFR
jgi:subtilase family serine protease